MTDRLLRSPSLEQYGVVSPVTTVLINRPYEASHGEKVPLLSFSTEPRTGKRESLTWSRCSISQLPASLGARAPSESFIILSAVAPLLSLMHVLGSSLQKLRQHSSRRLS